MGSAPGIAPRGLLIENHYSIKREANVRRNPRDLADSETGVKVWSGIVAFRENRDKAIKEVGASWTVPNCYPPGGADQGAWYTCSSWIGIDGANRKGDDSSGQVLQVGVESHVMQHSHLPSRWACAWWEWYPGPTCYLPSLPVSPGDRLEALIMAKSKKEAFILLRNVTSGLHIQDDVTPPENVELKGNCAEWIVEKTSFARSDNRLASYGEVWFSPAYALTDDGRPVKIEPPNVLPQKIQTESDTPVDLSVAELSGVETRDGAGKNSRNTLVKCKYVGPVFGSHLVPKPVR
jgi:hypothetical protein